jgi:transcriptional regulator with XRE-family HTH domain
MLKTPEELRRELGQAIRARRIGQGWSQEEAATRAGMGLSTWKQMETHGPGHVGNLINAAVALRCEEGLGP